MLTPSHNDARAVGDRWSCVHVYHAGNLDRLLREVVFPATAQMQTENLISYWFFIRYWVGGTHLRIRLFPSQYEDRDLVCNTLIGSIEPWLRNNPSSEIDDWTRLPDNDLLYKRMFNLEYRNAPISYESFNEELSPNDSVTPTPYFPELERYGGTSGIDCCFRQFSSSTEFVKTLIENNGVLTLGFRQAATASALMVAVEAFFDSHSERINFTKNYRDYWTQFGDYTRAESQSASQILRLVKSNKGPEFLLDALNDYREGCFRARSHLEEQIPDSDKRKRIYSSLIHMTNNRLGLSPTLESNIAHQLCIRLAEDQ